MIFQFDSFSDFWQMDGHGFYVWLAYGITLLVLATLILVPMLQLRLLRSRARRARQLEEALAQGKPSEAGLQ